MFWRAAPLPGGFAISSDSERAGGPGSRDVPGRARRRAPASLPSCRKLSHIVKFDSFSLGATPCLGVVECPWDARSENELQAETHDRVRAR